MKALIAALATTAIIAPAGFAVGKAYSPSPVFLQREINGLQAQVTRLRVRASNDEFNIGNLQDCEHSLATAWRDLYIDPYGGLNKEQLNCY